MTSILDMPVRHPAEQADITCLVWVGLAHDPSLGSGQRDGGTASAVRPPVTYLPVVTAYYVVVALPVQLQGPSAYAGASAGILCKANNKVKLKTAKDKYCINHHDSLEPLYGCHDANAIDNTARSTSELAHYNCACIEPPRF